METLYKKKKNGLGERTIRAKLKETSSKNKRADLLAAKRNISRTPLGVLQGNDERVQSNDKVPTPAKKSRLDKMKEWKKQRDEARAKVEKKKPPFRCGRPIITNYDPRKQNTNESKAIHFTTGTIHKPSVAQCSSTSHLTSSVSTFKPEASVKPSAPATRSRSKTSKNPAVPTRASSRLAAKEESTKQRQTTHRPQTRTVAKSTRAAKTAKKSPVQHKTTTRSKQASSAKLKKTAEKKTPPEAVETVEVAPKVKPTTPAKSHVPVTPSPLLRSQRPKTPKHRTPFVNHPAWIPYATLSPSSTSQPNFDAAFDQPMSPFPFTFTAGTETETSNSQQFAFTFKKDMPPTAELLSLKRSSIHLSDSLSDESIASCTSTSENVRVTPNPKLVSNSLSKNHSSKKRNRRVTNYEDDLVVQVLDMDCEDPLQDQDSEGVEPLVLESEQEKEHVDVAYFRGLHADVVQKLTELCQAWDQKAEAFEQEETDGDNCNYNKEEVLGQIRTTVCQAQLLMRQKLKQYLGLVDDAETQRGERKTTAEDLQGFWDMVYFQVEDVCNKFDGLSTLENNGWEQKPPTPKKTVGKKRRAKSKKNASTTDASNNARLQAAREKREAQRNRLKELKMAAKKAQQEEINEPVVAELESEPQVSPPKKAKTVRSLTPSSGSQRSRRRSQRLMMRSVFSPTVTAASPRPMNEVPIAKLLDL